MDSISRHSITSLVKFVFSSFDNKGFIFGYREPQFLSNTVINKKINDIPGLTKDIIKILEKAISAENYFLIQGPPGTGKTSVVLRYLVHSLYANTNENILLLAYTNRAVDEICSSISLNKESLPDFDFIRLGIKETTEYRNNLLSEIDIISLPDRMNKCRVFVATVTTANSHQELFDLKKFTTAIIDEAAQIQESVLVGILSQCKRFIMIGDEKQLPPISLISGRYTKIEAPELNSLHIENASNSLFDRLLKISKEKG
jgi:DNA replication ATP-dependent helicase Dna2